MYVVLKTVFVKRLGGASPPVYSVAVEDLEPILVKEVLLGHVLGLLLGTEAGDALKIVIYGPTGEFKSASLDQRRPGLRPASGDDAVRRRERVAASPRELPHAEIASATRGDRRPYGRGPRDRRPSLERGRRRAGVARVEPPR